MKKLLFLAILFVTAAIQCSLQTKLSTHQAQIKTMKTDVKKGNLNMVCSACGTDPD